jgi:hypothetical protein
MKVQFIHHASFLLSSDSDGTSILTDPWFFGSAFLDGWDLMWPLNNESLESLSHPDYIWISHEHPDHFSIPTLKKMTEFSKSIFLYQETSDQRVINYLKSNGYRTKTVPNGKLLQLCDSVSLLVRSIGTGDSYCIFQIDDKVFVDTNDAILLPRDLKQLQEDTRKFKQIDVLTTQFGIAGKVGNALDVDLRLSESQEIRELVIRQLEAIKPTYFIPSASMKVFSKNDNFYMNQGQSSLNSLFKMVIERSSAIPVFLDSFECWSFQGAPDAARLIEKFDSILFKSSISALNHGENASADGMIIQSAIDEWWKRQRLSHSFWGLLFLRLLPGGFRIKKLRARLIDTGELVWITPPLFMLQIPLVKSREMEIEVQSSVLVHALRDDFGLMSLLISARYQGSLNSQKALRTLAWIGSQRAAGRAINAANLTKNLTRGVSFIFKRKQTL